MAMEMESGVSMDTAGRYFRKPLFKHICKQKSQWVLYRSKTLQRLPALHGREGIPPKANIQDSGPVC